MKRTRFAVGHYLQAHRISSTSIATFPRCTFPKAPLIFVVLASIASTVEAADFRGNEFGKSCKGIEQHEIALGSKLSSKFQREPLVPRFDGTVLERRAFITYLCGSEELLQVADVRFPERDTFGEAAADFRAAYDFYTGAFGSPQFLIQPGHPARQSSPPPVTGKTAPEQFSAFWNAGKTAVHVKLSKITHGPATIWQASIVESEKINP